jgi:nitrous oxidase accessory protein
MSRSLPVSVLMLALAAGNSTVVAAEPVKTTEALIAAVRDGKEGDTIELTEGRFELPAVLELKARMTLKGAGMERTILTATPDRRHSMKSIPDPEMTLDGLDTNAYLIRIKRDTAGVTISHLTLSGPNVHGAVFSWFHTGLNLHHVRIRDMAWSGLRSFGMVGAKIHDCEFVDAGGRWDRGEPGVKGGITGGGIFACWMRGCEIFNNRFTRSNDRPEREFYGIKVRQGIQCRVHHNTIMTGFSMEFPFENDEDNELDHNVCRYAISIPKYAGGVTPKSGKTFHIHHNWFKDSYSIEFVRNGVEIDHNLFDFDVKEDHGNLIAGFGDVAARGPAKFHHNLVSNPGRGVVWINEIFNNLEVSNNHILCRPTVTPRTEGLFGFHPGVDFKTIVIKDNIIECVEKPRPLLRCDESYAAIVENNRLVNVSDAGRLKNPKADRPVGLGQPLRFECGAHGEFTVDDWKAGPTKR